MSQSLKILFCVVLFYSCDCNYHLRRAAIKCGNKETKDTIIVHDTIKVSEVKTDTLFNWIGQTDTFYINKDRLHIKYFKKDSLVYISGKCDSLIVHREIKVPYEKVVLSYEVYKTWWFWVIIAGIILLLYLVRRK